jgi:uncharacterized protein YxjI
MSNPQGTPAGWYPDPMGRHEYRWFDGNQWTDAVSSHGKQATDPVNAPPTMVQGTTPAEKIQQQVTKQAGVTGGAAPGGGTLFTEPILVVNQKARLVEINNEYAIHDQNGTQIGAIRQVGQSTAKKVMRVLTNVDQYMTHKLQVVDRDGSVALQLTRPAKLVKSKIIVQNGQGVELGTIVQQNAIGKIRFGLMAPQGQVGQIQAENWRAWNFRIADAADNEVARITKTWEGLAKTLFTTADNYVVQIHAPLAEPLRSLVVAAAVSVDLALKLDSRGFS